MSWRILCCVVAGLGLSDDEDLPSQMSREDWPSMKQTFASIFATKTQAEWTHIFEKTDACTSPVLTRDEASEHPHNKTMGHFLRNTKGGHEPAPAPLLSRTPGSPSTMALPAVGQDTLAVLVEAGYSKKEVKEMCASGVAEMADMSPKL